MGRKIGRKEAQEAQEAQKIIQRESAFLFQSVGNQN
jgi:hypothetical protein